VLRELNKGLAKGQTIKGAEFDRQTADLKREDLRPVKEVQEEMERRARSRSGEKSRQQARPRRAERDQRPAQEQGRAQTPDEGKQWALEMRIRAEAKQDREAESVRQELLEQSRARVNGWMEREQVNVAREVQRLAQRQDAERAELEKKIEQAQKIGTWREGGPERTAQQQRSEPGEQQEHGRGGRTRER